MIYKPFFTVFILALFFSCKQEPKYLYKIEGSQTAITDSLQTNPEIENYIKPYRNHVNKSLDTVLAYAPSNFTKNDGDLNSSLGNLMADQLFAFANPVFNQRTGKNIDLVLLNHGGMRASISKGNVTPRTAFSIMPFENEVVVTTLKGTQVNKLVQYLVKRKKAHPIHGLKIILNNDYSLNEATINNEKINSTQYYQVATIDYLYNGGDGMDFFKPNDSLYQLNYKLRNLLIDYFKKTDTIQTKPDNRFIKLP